jgi:hypothetical protein
MEKMEGYTRSSVLCLSSALGRRRSKTLLFVAIARSAPLPCLPLLRPISDCAVLIVDEC